MSHVLRGVAWTLLLALTVSPGAVEARKTKKKGGPTKPALHLRADIQAGFTPLTIHFTSRLENVEADAEEFCHAGTFLMLGGSERIISGENPACLHPPEQRKVSLSFSHTFTVTRSGYYEFLTMVKKKDGTEIRSNAVPVRVLSSPGGR